MFSRSGINLLNFQMILDFQMLFQTPEHLDLIRCVPGVTAAKTAHFYWILSAPDLVHI